MDKITHLVASPLRRTIYTCLLSFAPAVARGVRVVALPEVQEVSSLPCDTGNSPAVLGSEFKDTVDLGLVGDDWLDKEPGSRWAPDPDKIDARARAARVWLRNLAGQAGEAEDAHIVVVTHGGFLHFLTEDWDGMKLEKGTGWVNTEWRSYAFEDGLGKDPGARLVETDDSWRTRRGSTARLTDAEQMQLRTALGPEMEGEYAKLAEEMAQKNREATQSS